MHYLTLLVSGLMGGFASILLRLAALKDVENIERDSFFESIGSLRFFSVFLYGLGFVLYSFSLRNFNLTIAYPVMISISISTTYIFTLLVERLYNFQQFVGLIFIISGVFLLSTSMNE